MKTELPPTTDTLPLMPEPDDTDGTTYAAYSSDAMREYALAAIQQERERCARLCDNMERDIGSAAGDYGICAAAIRSQE